MTATSRPRVDAGVPAGHLLRITTLNVNHDPCEMERRTGLLCDELGALAPEILCLQELNFARDGSSAQLAAVTAETGLPVVAGAAQFRSKHGILTGNAILSNLPVIEAGTIDLGTPGVQLTAADYAVLQAATGQSVIVVSAHLCWGGNKEGVRLAQVTAIDARVRSLVGHYRDRHPVAVLAGDFNSEPDSDTHRFLAGRGAGADGGYTYWTDAFAAAGDPAEAVTVAGGNHWAQATARGVGIEFPELLPDRRIDFVYVYDWAYGRPGSPVAVRRCFTDTTRYGFPASDHYGLTADLWTPPVPGASEAPSADRTAVPLPARDPVLV